MPAHRARSLVLPLLALALGSTSLQCPIHCPERLVSLPGFLLGFSQIPSDVVALSTELGLNAVRPQVTWRTLEPTVVVEGLTRADVQNEAAVVQYLDDHDWSASDAQLGAMLAAGLYPIPIVGHGFSSALPLLGGVPAAPDVLGREEYLARQYLVTRATVERYDGDGSLDAPGSPRVPMWQLENEPNQAFFTAIFGWREPTFFNAFGSAWSDVHFMNDLLVTIRRAVRDADPTALTTINFHSDVHPDVNLYLRQPPWQTWVGQWRDLIDVVGLDAYPNYYAAEPVAAAAIGARIEELRQISCGRPVMVIETGYPKAPTERGFDETKQAQYVQEAYDQAIAAGAVGFLLFGARDTRPPHSVEITQEDVENLQFLADAFESGDAATLLTFALENADYVQNHLAEVLQSVEPYWGVVRLDGTHTPAWNVLAAIAAGLATAP